MNLVYLFGGAALGAIIGYGYRWRSRSERRLLNSINNKLDHLIHAENDEELKRQIFDSLNKSIEDIKSTV